ncbi:MAG: 16S rRNA (cytosine(1402)-N(4))-methyltransferase RsmH [Bdellovibrionota bacterium]|nr:MAG: 16S rRNA (cytosine(1402)-N(4))-methyltransferase RsmH [Bdellovibrionota bacterium]
MSISDDTRHVPVMKEEVLDLLRAAQGGTFLDCTFGGGGHTLALLEAHQHNRIVAVDRDPQAISRGQKRFAAQPRLRLLAGAFSDLPRLVPDERFDGVLADLGMSTDQLWAGRGFSFNDTDALDMRMNPQAGVSAADLLNTLTQSEIARILKEGGVGKDAAPVARAIVKARPITSAAQLAELVRTTLTAQAHSETHPATVVFQALRMAVNDERGQLQALLAHMPALVRTGGRFAAICFHSEEDKLVTRSMRHWEGGGEYSATWPGASRGRSLGTLITKGALLPTDAEVASNPSARSARMRCFEFN